MVSSFEREALNTERSGNELLAWVTGTSQQQLYAANAPVLRQIMQTLSDEAQNPTTDQAPLFAQQAARLDVVVGVKEISEKRLFRLLHQVPLAYTEVTPPSIDAPEVLQAVEHLSDDELSKLPGVKYACALFKDALQTHAPLPPEQREAYEKQLARTACHAR